MEIPEKEWRAFLKMCKARWLIQPTGTDKVLIEVYLKWKGEQGYQTLCMNCQWVKKAEVCRQRRLP